LPSPHKPLFKLTQQDSGYTSGTLPRAAHEAFETLWTQLGKEPTLAFPWPDREYLQITNTFKPTQNLPRGLCATLAQVDKKGLIQVISHASRQLKDNEKNYSPFLLEASASVWGMDNFN
jgi:hypothetical protein